MTICHKKKNIGIVVYCQPLITNYSKYFLGHFSKQPQNKKPEANNTEKQDRRRLLITTTFWWPILFLVFGGSGVGGLWRVVGCFGGGVVLLVLVN